MFQRNTLISLTLASALLVSGINVSFADGHKTPDERTAKLQRELNLTDDQTKKVNDIYKGQHDKAEKIRKDAADLRADTNKKIDGVLNPEQRKKFDAMNERHMMKKDRKDKNGN